VITGTKTVKAGYLDANSYSLYHIQTKVYFYLTTIGKNKRI